MTITDGLVRFARWTECLGDHLERFLTLGVVADQIPIYRKPSLGCKWAYELTELICVSTGPPCRP